MSDDGSDPGMDTENSLHAPPKGESPWAEIEIRLLLDHDHVAGLIAGILQLKRL